MTTQAQLLDEVHRQLGHGRLTRSFAKLEILAGLTAAGIGLFLGNWATQPPLIDGTLTAAALLLFVLGSYLALAGHRSHLYQSNNELTAFLLGAIRAQRETGGTP